ncbi:MAG: deoxyribose-phosphate aldolase [Phycisphaerales bacterium]|nr:deoxyribose-phosphate aldolase [Phycisphaerales bacterium]
MDKKEIAAMMDLSCVRADSTLSEIDEAVAISIEHGVFAIFVLPAHMPYLIEKIGDAPVLAAATVGFPDGAASTAGKVAEVKEQMAMGCKEFDMVNNIAWLKSGRDDLYRDDIRAVVDAADGLPVKVILECHYLTDAEIVRACGLAVDAGVEYVKTGTGWAPTGATLENIALMKKTVGDRCRVKAAGGVADKATLLAMHAAGAARFGIGVRTAKCILEDADGGGSY